MENLGAIDPTRRAERPAYVRFQRSSREDRGASIQAGHIVEVHEDMVYINPPGSRDIVERSVDSWLVQLEAQARERMIPESLLAYYRDAYDKWCAGQEIPPAGTPIKGWQLLSTTEQMRVVDANILTVEDLAEASHAQINAIGMGSPAMVAKAKHWLVVGRDQGVVAMQLADMAAQIESLQAQLAERPTKRMGWPKGRKRGPRKPLPVPNTDGPVPDP